LEGIAVRAIADDDFDPAKPVQTRNGARQALRVGHNRVERLIKDGRLKVVYFGRLARITTDSILAVAAVGDPEKPAPRRSRKNTASASAAAE
jgi:hypothetical protein